MCLEDYDSFTGVLGWRSRWIVKPGNAIYVVSLNNWPDSDRGFTTLDLNVVIRATCVSYSF